MMRTEWKITKFVKKEERMTLVESRNSCRRLNVLSFLHSITTQVIPVSSCATHKGIHSEKASTKESRSRCVSLRYPVHSTLSSV
jgi:hypothetical protein